MPEPRPRRVTVSGAVVLAVVLGAVVAGCGGEAGASGMTTSPPAAGGGATRAPALATPPPAGTALVVDARLLSILPVSVSGVAVQPAPDSAAQMAADAALGHTASGVAVGIVVAPGTSGGDDLAIATVIQLRPGVFSDRFYDAWRDEYDRAACEPAGGVSSHVQQLIGPHTVEVTVCAQGARTYHTHLPGDRLVSITAVGDHRFGDLVMAGLRQ